MLGQLMLARAEQQLHLHGSRDVIVAAVNSEPGTLPHRPLTRATRVPRSPQRFSQV